MDLKTVLDPNKDCIEAETVSNDDSEKSSLLEFFDLKFKENCLTDELFKLKNLIEDLESSLRISNNIDHSLLLKCVLLEAENHNLKRKINSSEVKVNNLFCRDESTSPNAKSTWTEMEREDSGWEAKESGEKQSESISPNEGDSSSVRETIIHLEKELKERERTIALLCEKYLYLKNNKNRMEISLKKKIGNLEKLLNVTYGALQESHEDMETKIDKYLSKTKNICEALFLQEKWRCTKLMYENIRFQRDMGRSDDGGGRQGERFLQADGGSGSNCSGKFSDEALMRFNT